MAREPAPALNDAGPPETEAERLITRLVDGEASDPERNRFERMAVEDRALWRSLAVRQLQMIELSHEVAVETDAADRVDLPLRRRPWINLSVTISGWAAVLALGLLWALGDMPPVGEGGPPRSVPVIAPQAPEATSPLSPQEHLGLYLQADHVLGELDPILLETEALPDGRKRLRFIRRIEEYSIVDGPPDE